MARYPCRKGLQLPASPKSASKAGPIFSLDKGGGGTGGATEAGGARGRGRLRLSISASLCLSLSHSLCVYVCGYR